MERFKNEKFEGERSLFKKSNIEVIDCAFGFGESPLKEGQNIKVDGSNFGWKYPLWYCFGVLVTNCSFEKMARAGIWYTKDIVVSDSVFESPKMFRRCENVKLKNVEFKDGQETLWHCENVTMESVKSKGDYFGMNSKKIVINKFELDGNYPFDGCEDIEIHNSSLNSKDAFWNCKHVKIFDSTIKGEYFGWNSEDVELVNCHIESLQGMCYMKKLRMIHCTLAETTLSFEYSDFDAQIDSMIDSVKNPSSGKLICKGIRNLIMEKDKINLEKTVIIIED